MKKAWVKRTFGFICAGWLMGIFALAPVCSRAEGTTGAEFLNLIPGARSAALSGSYCAAGNDAESVFANPAGILGLINPQVGMAHLAWWDGVMYDALWGVQPLGELGSFGFAATMLNVLPFNSTEDPGAETASAWNLLFAGSYALKVHRSLALGAQLKFHTSTLGDYQAWGMAMDLGVQYFLFNDQFIAAATVKNIGMQSAFLQESDTLPMGSEIGIAYQFWPDDPYRLLVAGTVTIPWQSRPSVSVGAEGWVENILALRAGVTFPQDAGNWLTVGTGVRWHNLHVDYALSPLGVLGMVHRLSLGYDFGSQKHLARPKLKVALIKKQYVYPDGDAGYAVHFIPKALVAAGVANWEIIIKNKDNQKIRKFSGEQNLPMEIVWDGLDALGKRVNMESTYYYHVRVNDRQGYSAFVQGEILPVSITSLPKLKAVPRDIFAGKVSFQPKNAGNTQEWSIDIVSDEGKILRKYQGVGAIPKDFSWDGKDERNHQIAVKAGYHFVMKVKDKSNNEMRSVAPIIMVDAGTKAWVESGEAISEQVPFHFEPTDIKIKRWVFDVIETDSGEVVRSYEGTAPLPDQIIWDSRDESGKKVETNKRYSYVLRMQDQIGNVWQQAAGIESTAITMLPSVDGKRQIKVEQILFDFNKAELKKSMFQKLKKVADLIRAHNVEKTKLLVAGYTDEVGTEKYNLELSLKRAHMVMRFLVEEENLPSATMTVEGYGKKHPVVQGRSPEAQAKNRRVEITLIFEK